MLCWHLLPKENDYFWARPSLVARKTRSMDLQAGQPQTKGNKRGPAYAYNIKELRDQEMRSLSRPRSTTNASFPKEKARGRLNPARLE